MAKANPTQQYDMGIDDRISNLPDSILCHILSFIPTKDSVITSCLSKRWRFTWTSVPVLDLSDEPFESMRIPKRRRTAACKKSFKHFVNMVLILRSHPCVQLFSLELTNSYPESDVHSWICAAITHNVQELVLSMRDGGNLPRIIFNCATIVSLKLDSEIGLNVPESVYLPSLKVLNLRDIPTISEASISRLLLGSPILEELLIHRHKYQDYVKTFKIVSSSLKAFELKNPGYNEEHYGVLIDAPKLEFLELVDERIQQVEVEIEFKNAPSLAKATLNFTGLNCHEEEHIRTITFSLRKLRNVKVLRSPLILLNKKALLNDGIWFPNLTELFVSYCGHDFPMLTLILTKLPSLQGLILEKASFYCYHPAAKIDSWKKEKLEIICLKYSLKRLQIKKFKGNEEDMEIVEYFVKNAKILNEIRLVTRYTYHSLENGSLNKLLALQRCSNAFKIVIC